LYEGRVSIVCFCSTGEIEVVRISTSAYRIARKERTLEYKLDLRIEEIGICARSSKCPFCKDKCMDKCYCISYNDIAISSSILGEDDDPQIRSIWYIGIESEISLKYKCLESLRYEL
jgi:hypothetical protein